jgi:hypothetical protein
MEAFAGEVFVGCAHELAELGRAIDSAELAPPRSGMSAVVLTGRAIPSTTPPVRHGQPRTLLTA